MFAQADAPTLTKSPAEAAPAARGSSPTVGMTTGLLKLLGNMAPKSQKSAQPANLPPPEPLPNMVPGSSAAMMPRLQPIMTQSPFQAAEQPQPAPAAREEIPPSSSPFAFATIQERPGTAQQSGREQVTFDQLMSQRPLDPAGKAVSGLDNMRQELVGKYYEETEGRFKELRTALDGGLARSRKAAFDRIDELSAAMHRDMVALRQEMHNELEELKRDVFSAVMSLSALNDKMSVTETRAREVATAITHGLNDRMAQQTALFESALVSLQARMEDFVTQKVTATLHQAIQDLIRQQIGSQPLAHNHF